ncbi:hypothetical protein RND81_10G066000 [Saponaria officinalis]|uniref:Myb-like domain-containing protein n=1 Tax=Saponaria officinalis TaxID=3572 RepID=A0AAW1HYT4_SAPOF
MWRSWWEMMISKLWYKEEVKNLRYKKEVKKVDKIIYISDATTDDDTTTTTTNHHNHNDMMIEIVVPTPTSSHHNNHHPNPTKKQAETWVQEETQNLINLRREMDSLFNTSKSNKHLWEEISLKMREHGFDRSPTMCTDKWRNLLKEFKKVKNPQNQAN